jgi:hypothetical protein
LLSCKEVRLGAILDTLTSKRGKNPIRSNNIPPLPSQSNFPFW